MTCAAPNVPIYSMDVAPQNDERLRQIFAESGEGTNVTLLVGDSQQGKFSAVGPYDVLFIDGDHSHEGCSVTSLTGMAVSLQMDICCSTMRQGPKYRTRLLSSIDAHQEGRTFRSRPEYGHGLLGEPARL